MENGGILRPINDITAVHAVTDQDGTAEIIFRKTVFPQRF